MSRTAGAVALALTLVSAALTVHARQSAPPEPASITAAGLRADLFFLAGDGLKGRLTDTPENAIAADWIKATFEKLGLAPAGPGGSYFQPYNLITASQGADNGMRIAQAGGASLQLRAGQDFYPHRFSASGTASGAVVFAGFGLSAPERSYDDYRGVDVKGKVALILDHEPGERDPASPFDGVVTSEASAAWRKAMTAQDKGAIALLIVDDVHNHEGPSTFAQSAASYWPAAPPRVERYTLQAWADRIRIPVVQISPALGEILVRGTSQGLASLSRASEKAGAARPLPGVEVGVTASVVRTVVGDRNVLAKIEGADPTLKNEVVIVCAHYDHEGADGPRIYNGADDDGSGTVALMAIAEAYAVAAKAGRRPGRSVLFAAWNSEERGLLGAWAYTEDPAVPLDRTVAVLNMDMVGRNEEVPGGNDRRFRGLAAQTAESNANAVNVIGTTRSTVMRAETEKANGGIGLDLRFRYDNNESNLMRRSDHWPFLNRGVPGVWFHTGLHPDYHTIYDRPERINYTKMEKVARLVYRMSWNLADQGARPKLDGKAPTAIQ